MLSSTRANRVRYKRCTPPWGGTLFFATCLGAFYALARLFGRMCKWATGQG